MAEKEERLVLERLEIALSDAITATFAISPRPKRPLTHLIEALRAIDAADTDGDGLLSAAERVARARHEQEARDAVSLGKYATDAILVTNFAAKCQALARIVSRAPPKKVLFVIDVQDGYDGEFVSSLPPDQPGGLAYIQGLYEVRASYELVSKRRIGEFGRNEMRLSYDKVWNRGLDGVEFGRVAARVVKELQSGLYDLVVFTSDYLERSDGEEKGVFALDDTPWSEATKPVAHVSYHHYLTINAGGLGTNVSRRIRAVLPEVTNARGAEGSEVCGVPCVYVRKQVDDAFDEGTETSERTLGQPWLDNVDVDDHGLPKPKAETLLAKLRRLGFGPEQAEASFCGVVTNRCVASSLLHAVENGYRARLIEGGCMAASDDEHAAGVSLIREKGGLNVEVVP